MSCKNCNCEECKKKKAKALKNSINCCKDCGSIDIKIQDCGYTTFNCGQVECRKCKNDIQIQLGPDENHKTLIKAWNKKNPTKEQEVKLLEKSISEITEKIKKVKARKW
jgi:hypothetical protein